MNLQQTLSNGTKIWKPNRRVLDGGKQIKFESLTPTMPLRSETIRSEEVVQLKYSSTTGLKRVLTEETNSPIDVITLVSGEIWLITKDLLSGIETKTRLDSSEPKLISVPLKKCAYGVYAISNNTVLIIKKNYRSAITEISQISL